MHKFDHVRGIGLFAGDRVCAFGGAKTLFTARDHPDLQAEPRADVPYG
jgi:hypothetical protein